MRRLLIASVLLAGLLAAPVAAQAKPLPKTATFKVEYDGQGTWSRDSGFTAPCTTSTSTERSTFDWDITWKKVTVHLRQTKAPTLSQPKGLLKVVEDHETKYTDSCGGPVPEPCSMSNIRYTGPEKDFGYLRIGKQGQSNDLLILPDADASIIGDSDNCGAYGDEAEHKGMYVDNFGSARTDLPSPLEAVGARIPIKEALSSGKHIVFVKNGPTNLPGDGFNCAPADSFQTCTESQSWDGHITLTRIG